MVDYNYSSIICSSMEYCERWFSKLMSCYVLIKPKSQLPFVALIFRDINYNDYKNLRTICHLSRAQHWFCFCRERIMWHALSNILNLMQCTVFSKAQRKTFAFLYDKYRYLPFGFLALIMCHYHGYHALFITLPKAFSNYIGTEARSLVSLMLN